MIRLGLSLKPSASVSQPAVSHVNAIYTYSQQLLDMTSYPPAGCRTSGQLGSPFDCTLHPFARIPYFSGKSFMWLTLSTNCESDGHKIIIIIITIIIIIIINKYNVLLQAYTAHRCVHIMQTLTCRGNLGKPGYSGKVGNRCIRRIALSRIVFSLPTGGTY